jgi:hypothetical protein
MRTENKNDNSVLKTGYYSSILLAFVTFVTFAVAMTAVPKSGPFCLGNCIDYPYLDSLKFYPGDYYWIYLAIGQICIWMIFMVSFYFISFRGKKIFGFISISFMLASSIILLADYFVQITVLPISLMKGETDGIALLTQYNDHGVFIALEELGYLLMSISLLFLAFVFPRGNKLERAIQITFLLPFILSIISMVFFSLKFGIDRSYRFEIAVITINWLALIIVGILAGVYFKRQLR